MNRRGFLAMSLLVILLLAGIVFIGTVPVRASAVSTVSLDANSTSQTDSIVSSSANQSKSFRVGAVLNGSGSSNPVSNVFAWQFQIDYNASAFVPQDDPSTLSAYPDGAANTVLFGAQTTPGTVNWAAKITVGQAFGSSQITHNVGPSQDGIIVFYTIIGPNPAVSISANTLLGSVSFELINKPTTPQVFTISNVIVSDQNSQPILSVTSGVEASEAINNNPPTASFAVNALPIGDSSCTRITGSPCTGFAFKFAGSDSSDSDGTIANPAGYFWDFGDGSQDSVNAATSCPILNCTQGAVAIHDYGTAGTIQVTLRVVDNQGATGSARDSLGSVITNNQQSHTSMTVVAALGFTITANPTALSIGPNSAGPIGTSTITLMATQQTAGTVTLSASTNPSGANAPTFSFSSASVVLKQGGTNSSVLTVSVASNTPHLDYNVTVTGTLGSVNENVTLRLIPTTISVHPSFVRSVTLGSTFSVSIDASTANLFAFQFQLNYNSTLLSASASSVSFGPFWTAAAANHQGFQIKRVNQTAGTILLADTLLPGATTFTGNGTLTTITFTVQAFGITPLALSNVFLINGVGIGQNLPSSQKNGLFCSTSCLDHDIAVTKFSISPSTATIGNVVTLSTSISNLGLNTEMVQLTFYLVSSGTPIYQVIFPLAAGNSTTITYKWDTSNVSPGPLTLTAQAVLIGTPDQNPANNNQSQQVTLNPPALQHDVAVASVSVKPQILVSGQRVSIEVGLANPGLSTENVSLAVFYDQHEIANLNGIILVGESCCRLLKVVWDTSDVPAGNYTISATVFLSTDQNPVNNHLSDGLVQILPPPTLTVTPSEGGPGTKILVQGSGFLGPPGPTSTVETVLVNFDDMFMGIASAHNGSFNFTFDVPSAEPGAHLVKALDLNTLNKASASFQVLPGPNIIVISLDTGSVYFPDDTATINLMISVNGVTQTPKSVKIGLVLFKPDRSNTTLTLTPLAPGYYEASFIIPKVGSIGTYTVLARVEVPGPLDASAIRTFEVKPTWLTSQSKVLVAGTVLVGLAGVLIVAGRKGCFRRRNSPLDSPL